MEKLTKKDIISNIAEDSHLTKKDITEVVDSALTQIFEGLSEGKTVDLAGFGKFEITERKAREGFNPLTKEKIQIEASKSVKFKVAKALKDSALLAAKRELEEETGYVSNDWKHIYTIPSNPTIADNYAFLYYADDCEKICDQHLDSTEFIEVKEYTEDEINDLIKNNEFVQPIHLMGWLMVKKGVL